MAGVLLSVATWTFLGLAAAILSGVISASIQLAGFAPIGLTSVATGFVLGVSLAGLAYLCQAPPNRTMLLLTFLFATAAVVTQHLSMYRGYCDQWHRVHDENPAITLFRNESAPKSIGVYMWAEATPMRTLIWGFDAVLISATTAGFFVIFRLRPAQPSRLAIGNQRTPSA